MCKTELEFAKNINESVQKCQRKCEKQWHKYARKILKIFLKKTSVLFFDLFILLSPSPSTLTSLSTLKRIFFDFSALAKLSFFFFFFGFFEFKKT